MDNSIKSNTSFWSEISDYKIQVPYYQRDYAQGRKDGGRIDNIRKVFVEEMYRAIKGSNNECHLGLVFGSYNENEKVFIAVDGQQRLTTVFLLHWYVAWRENKLNDYKDKLLNFSWDTRSYSSQFVELLFKILPSNNVIDAIKTNSNYFSVWENDPTVKGMLTMLEEIESQYHLEDCNLCNSLFTDNCNIQYDILKLEKDSDGKTYLKMNSRGRSLTTFELFKSKFLDKYHPNFGLKFDNEWLSFMLQKFASSDSLFSDPDVPFMNFINEYTYLQLKLKSDSDDSNDYKEFIDAKVKGELTDIPFVSFEKYDRVFEGDQLADFKKTLDWICQNYENVKLVDDEVRFSDSRFFLDAIIKDNNPNFSHRSKLFAAFKYAALTDYALLDIELYKKWTRVFRNLIANTDIDSSNLGSICKSINKIDNANIYDYLSNGRELAAFTKEQIAEEIAKSKKILDENGDLRKYNVFCKKGDSLDDKTWEDIIIETESYAFFKGAIRFLFTDGEGNIYWGDFDTKWDTAHKYFDDAGIKQDYKIELTKRLVIQCDDWGKQLYDKQIFNPNSSTWKWILCSENWREPINNILTKELTQIQPVTTNIDSNVEKYLTPLLNDLPFEWMTQKIPNGRFRWLGPRLAYYKPYGREFILFDWGDFKRSKILSSIDDINTNHKINNSCFFWGWDIQFIYKEKLFQWQGNNYVRLIEDLEKCEPVVKDDSRDNPEEKWFCFSPTSEMASIITNFTAKLDQLINDSQIYIQKI